MNLNTFCRNVVPDFTPLGGNRSDCAVVMAAAVSLLEDHQQPSTPSLLLPPDVLDTAMAATCATVIIRLASDVVLSPHGYRRGGRLSCRLEIGSETALDGFRNPDDDDPSYDDYKFSFDKVMPWRYFEPLILHVALPSSITSCPSDLLTQCRSLSSLDLRSTKLQFIGDYFLFRCISLKVTHLPDTLMTVGNDFLQSCPNLTSIDLRNTKLQSVGDYFLYQPECTSLKEVYLPETLHSVAEGFLGGCSSLVSIDLRNTKLQSVGDYFVWACTSLKEVHLPDMLSTAGDGFMRSSNNLHFIDLRNTKLHTAGRCFMAECEQLTSLHLPDTLMTVGACFLQNCERLVSIDLRNTKLHTIGSHFLFQCEQLTSLHLPDTLRTVGEGFLKGCKSLPQETIAVMKHSIEERSSEKRS